jgi:signal transduction histidine kinase
VIEKDGKSGSATAVQSDVVASASHELLSPLNLIGGYATTLLGLDETLSPEQRRRYLQGMQSATARAVRLVRNFLDVYRLESDTMGLALEPVDLRQLLEGVVAETQLQTPSHAIELSVPDDLPEVRVDPGKIERVIVNLLVNAVKYSPRGGHVRVSVQRVAGTAEAVKAAPGDRPIDLPTIIVSVEDCGVGIPEDALGKVFDKFYRVDGELTHTTPGVGLGLYISRLVVEAHGGSIWVRSRLGEGSVFSFSLPLPGEFAATSDRSHAAVRRVPSRNGST